MRNTRKGFTLLELVFVLVVLGILAAVALPKFEQTRQKALTSSVKQDITTIKRAIQTTYMIKGDVTDLSSAVEFNEKLWNLDETKLKLEYKISGITCVTIEVDKSTATHKVNVTVLPDSHEICKALSDAGVKNSSDTLY